MIKGIYTNLVNKSHGAKLCNSHGRLRQAEADTEKQYRLIQQSLDVAMLSQNLLNGEALTEFVQHQFTDDGG